MRLYSELKRATQILFNYPGQWALCGGVAASIYRDKARFTDDIDFALIDSPTITARDLASRVIRELGYKEYKGFVSIASEGSSQVCGLICARVADDQRFIGLDFILPVQFWVEDAVQCTQNFIPSI